MTPIDDEWHSKPPVDVMAALRVTHSGLDEEEARERLAKYGPNQLVTKKGRSALRMFLGEFRDLFVLLLIAATAVSAVLGETADATAIGAIVVLVALTGFVQEYRAERAIEAMKRLAAPQARVVRGGVEGSIPAEAVVPGDILVLESGDYVPADARLLETVELKTNEAVLTGESEPVRKEVAALEPATTVPARRDMVFTPTHVAYGRGKAVVTATGMRTEFGKIAGIVESETDEAPPLQRKLDVFAKTMAKVVVVIVGVIFVLEAFDALSQGGPITTGLTNALLSSISLAVSAVPEGLPAIVTVALALGAREFARRNAVVRRLSSAESMGAVTVICSDKTGTITKGEMTVRELVVEGGRVEVTGTGYSSAGEVKHGDESGLKGGVIRTLEIGAMCNNAWVARREGGGPWETFGDPTEVALLVSAAKAGLQRDVIEKDYPRVREVPFTSERKLMTTVHSSPSGEVMVFSKGAPETVLARCTRVLVGGKEVGLTGPEVEKIRRENERLAKGALRVLAMAYKQLPSAEDLDGAAIEEGLVFAGLQGMLDPPREEAISANRLCRHAGIQTVMITGDQKLTAMAVAEEVGILEKGELVLTGAELDALEEKEFEEKVGKVAVYARVSPEHKLRIVKAWKKRGQIVAMTGDGVNDAPALKAADVGVSMGVSGTDVAKEASDIVLADDNFATIVKAVEQGRVIYDNIRKYARFLIACNFDELAVIGLFAILGGVYGSELFPLPLSAAMILWINLVTDGAPAISLATDPPDPGIMARSPRNPSEGILHGMGVFVVLSFAMQAIGTVVVFSLEYYVWPAHGFGTPQTLSEARTAAFLQAVVFELLVVWNCRSEERSIWRMGKRALKNRLFLVAELGSAIASIGVIYLPATQALFGLYPLSLNDFVYVFGVAALGLLVLPEITMNRKFWRWS